MRLVVMLLACSLAAPVLALDVVQEQSTLGFKVLIGSRSVSGLFKSWSVDVDLDARTIAVAVETASATTGDALLDAIMHGAAWLDSSTYPQATFLSDDIVAVSGGIHRAIGTLNLKGVDVPLVVMIREPDPFVPLVYAVDAAVDRHVVGMDGFADSVAPTVVINGDIAVRPRSTLRGYRE